MVDQETIKMARKNSENFRFFLVFLFVFLIHFSQRSLYRYFSFLYFWKLETKTNKMAKYVFRTYFNRVNNSLGTPCAHYNADNLHVTKWPDKSTTTPHAMIDFEGDLENL